MKNLYFKVFPKGTCQVPGVVIGFPVLDVEPKGLGWEVQPSVRVFKGLDVSLPRLELGRRELASCIRHPMGSQETRRDETVLSCPALRSGKSTERSSEEKRGATARPEHGWTRWTRKTLKSSRSKISRRSC